MTRDELRERIEELLACAYQTGEQAALCPGELLYVDGYMADLVDHAMRLVDRWANGKETAPARLASQPEHQS